MASKQSKGPSKAEIEKLRKAVTRLTAGFFAAYGDQYQFMLVGPPGPRPPPKSEFNILNLSSY
ncbi:MAG TPA: hypothetical protein VFS13_17975 [Steroidobacteraceae bacterium]|jgi:hypothetical protein|nr:hypothetical protein [Steroidobacteraceae bacterium]